MELNVLLICLPAFIALLFKGGIYAYAYRSETHNRQTRLYLYFLFALSVQNIAEIFALYTANTQDVIPYFAVTIFYASSVVIIALLVHLALSLAFDDYRHGWKRWAVTGSYLYALLLLLLLILTPWLIQDYERLSYGFGDSITRVPGPLFFLFEIYAIGLFLASVAFLSYGARTQTSAVKRAKNSVLLLAIIPMTLVVISVLALLHFGVRWINASVVFPVAITYFLVVTAYAIHQHRLFDIQFFIPWSKVRARKTAFYDRIRAMIAEVADLGSVREATHRLSETLGCAVALVSTGKPVLAVAGSAQQMVAFPLEQLRGIDRIVVANEIADSAPDTYKLMQGHGVAAIVPFYPHSHSASGWMLLGDNFSEQVYTPLDFKMVEQLFDKMAELFLDKLLAMRTQLAAAERRLQSTELRLQEAETGMVVLRSEVESLREQNLRLAREQAADSLVATSAPEHGTLPGIVLLGRDKPLLKRLRRAFPQTDQYVGPDSGSFRRQTPPELLIGRMDSDGSEDADWLALLASGQSAALLYGDRARDFVVTHIEKLAGALIEILPENTTDEILARRIRALAQLRRATRAVTDPDCPLAGTSLAFHEMLRDAARLARFAEPLLIESADVRETVAVARYVHDTGARPGPFRVETALIAANRFDALSTECVGGTLLLTGLESLSTEVREPLITAALAAKATRTILGIDSADQALRARFHSFTLRLPTLRERRQDLPLLVHYFTLGYNLRAGTHAYLTQAELDDLMATHYPEHMDALRVAIFERLNAKHRSAAPAPDVDVAQTDKTLEEHVAAFEARLIEQTLERCQGNKSKAARMLGLKPNTLHYKLERYGLGGGPRNKGG
jgi:hypothetical protein